MPAQRAARPCCQGFAGVSALWLALAVVLPRTASSQAVISYASHGTDWAQGSCHSRDFQSPLNFDAQLKDPPEEKLYYHYPPIAQGSFVLRAHTAGLSIDMTKEEYGGVVHNGMWYALTRIDFHAGAEHLIQGKRNPLEVQLVHRAENNPVRQVVVSVLVWSEDEPQPPPALKAKYYPPDPAEIDFNANLQHFLMVEPPDIAGASVEFEVGQRGALLLGSFLDNLAVPGSGTYLSYPGSQTAPPCDERVVWYVRRTTMVASDFQVKALWDPLMRLTGGAGNYRSVMPLGVRTVQVFQAVDQLYQGTPPPPPRMPLGPNPRTDDERRAKLMVDHAAAKAEEAKDYIKDFQARATKAAKALRDGLEVPVTTTPPPPPPGYGTDAWAEAVNQARGSIYRAAAGVERTVKDVLGGGSPVAQELHREGALRGAAATAVVPPPELPTAVMGGASALAVAAHGSRRAAAHAVASR